MVEDIRDRVSRRLPNDASYPEGRPELGVMNRSAHDRAAAGFFDGPLGRFASDDEEVVVIVRRMGWPLRSVSRIMVQRNTDSHLALPLHGFHIKREMYGEWNTGIMNKPAPPMGPPWALSLPLRPLWGGLALNTLFYASLFALPLIVWPLARRRRRIRKGRCPACGYDLAATAEPVCPECGATRATRP
jgi:hypothetical protein